MYSDQTGFSEKKTLGIPTSSLVLPFIVLTCTFLVIWTITGSNNNNKNAVTELQKTVADLQKTVTDLQSQVKQLKEPELIISVLTAGLKNDSNWHSRQRRQSDPANTAFSVLLEHILNSMKQHCTPTEKFCFAGPKGEAGQQGLPGLPGFPGLKGTAGDKGSVGEKGEKGVVGKPGPAGNKGEPGIAGKDGRNGAAGPRGLKGEKGESNSCFLGILLWVFY
jgi:hypothetical protein